MSKIDFSTIEQGLTELIADYLDSEEIVVEEAIQGIIDPQPRDKTNLHILMAKSAMEVYKANMILTK